MEVKMVMNSLVVRYVDFHFALHLMPSFPKRRYVVLSLNLYNVLIANQDELSEETSVVDISAVVSVTWVVTAFGAVDLHNTRPFFNWEGIDLR